MKYTILAMIGLWWWATQANTGPKTYTVNKPTSPELVYFHNDMYPVKTFPQSR